MNYIEQIKGFWIAQEAYQLSTSEIALYFYLLETCNKTGWTGTFYRNNYKVMADLSIRSRKTLQSVRDKLKSAGILDYTQLKGNANVKYKLHDLGKKYLSKYTGSGTSKGTSKGTGSGTLNINQTKPNQTDNLSSDKLNTSTPCEPKYQKAENPPPGSAPPPPKYPFSEFWDLYDKKRGKVKTEKKWNRLSDKQKSEAMRALPAYVQSTPDVNYRKDPLTWLNGEHWNDEILKPKTNEGVKKSSSGFGPKNGGFNILAEQLKQQIADGARPDRS